jgi:hypothetical protein
MFPPFSFVAFVPGLRWLLLIVLCFTGMLVSGKPAYNVPRSTVEFAGLATYRCQ